LFGLVAAPTARSVLAPGELFFVVFHILLGQGFEPSCEADSVLVFVHPLGEQFVNGILVIHGFIYG